jgi:conjugative relaxase-like TrwC/TraI family protein
VLTLRKLTVAHGDAGAAGAVAQYPLERADSPQAYARGDYYLASGETAADGAGSGAPPRANAIWLGDDDALAALGLERGQEVTVEALAAGVQGQHASSGEQLRRPGTVVRELVDEHGKMVLDDAGQPVRERVQGVTSIDMTVSAPKSVSVLWAMANAADRAVIEDAMLTAAERTVQYMTQTKAIVHRRVDDARVREPGAGVAAACSLHVTARRAKDDRAPAPQLHVHSVIVGVRREDGQLVTPDSWEWFKHDAALDGGALFRAELADRLAQAGWTIEAETGRHGRFFEVAGVPKGLCEAMSPRTREVNTARVEVEQRLGVKLDGKGLAVLASETRQAKDHELTAEQLTAVWDALGKEHGFGPGSASRLRGLDRDSRSLEQRVAQTRGRLLGVLRAHGPTVSLPRARALLFEVSAGRLSPSEAGDLLGRLEASGELLALVDGRVTSHDIRSLEERVMEVAAAAAARGDQPLGENARAAGLAAAEEALGPGKQLDVEQRQAFELLTAGTGWACLTGRAGTGKGPTLHATAEAYRSAGWQVIACAMDGTTARRMAEQLGGRAPAMTVEQLKARLEVGSVTVDDRTVVIIDEASKIETGQWAEIAVLAHRDHARIVAVGHDGQHDAIELPGLFSEMLAAPAIAVSELQQIRRHRDASDPRRVHPWLRDYQVAVDEARGQDAVAILQENDALRLYDTRGEAMQGIVAEWDRWRRDYQPDQAGLIVHGPNCDVDVVNELAQLRRVDAGELGAETIPAVDRSYSLRAGDVVAIRNAAYQFEPDATGRRARRVENGQVAVVDSVDPERDRLRLMVREPGAEPRLVEIDQGRLRQEHARGERAAGVRLHYAMHSFPAQGATLRGTAALGGHWSQAKKETYVGDTRAVYRHTVHVARTDLGADGNDQDRVARYAQRIASSRERYASIRHAADPSQSIAVALPAERELPRFTAIEPEASLPEPAASVEAERAQPPLPHVSADATRDQAPPPDRVEAVDPVAPLRGMLGPERSEALAQRVQQHDQEAAQSSDSALAQTRREAAPALAALDGAGAYEAARLQQAADHARLREQQVTSRARELEQQAEQLGWRQRRERDQLLAEARVQRQLGAGANRDLIDTQAAVQRLRDQGRHPDDWLDRHAAGAAAGLAAERELAARREQHIHAQAENAVEQPGPHIRDSIGERPQQPGEQRERWEQLARDLEQHRLRHEIDVDQDTALGPEQQPGRGGTYQHDRRQLARRVEQIRADQGLQAQREQEAPEIGF